MTDLDNDRTILDLARQVLARHDHGIGAACNDVCALDPEERELRRASIHGEVPPIHGCPEGDSGFTPCCNRPPFELRGHRMTTIPVMVTCDPARP